MRRLASALLPIAVAAACLAGPSAASAAEPQVRVFQRKPFLRRERIEIAPYAGVTVNDALVRHFYTGARVNYHISEVLAVGVSGAKAFGQETDLFSKVQEDFALNPTVSKADWLGLAEVQYAFLYGKLVLFNSLLVHLDSSLVGGIGAVGTAGGNVGVAFDIGLGQRFFLARWLSLNLDLRHYSYLDEIRQESSLVHATTVQAGLSLFFPDFEYQTFR